MTTKKPTTTRPATQGKIEMILNRYLTRAGHDVASVRRALHLPASGAPVVTHIRGAYWVGTVQQEYCLRLGATLEQSLSTLANLGLR